MKKAPFVPIFAPVKTLEPRPKPIPVKVTPAKVDIEFVPVEVEVTPVPERVIPQPPKKEEPIPAPKRRPAPVKKQIRAGCNIVGSLSKYDLLDQAVMRRARVGDAQCLESYDEIS